MAINTTEVDEIFCAAIEISSTERRADFVQQACGQNAELRLRVEELVAAHFAAGSFLEPLKATVQSSIEGPIQEGPGTKIGRYKLLEQIGEGGMGVVYMAEQQTPVRRRVALKIIKAGMDTRQVIARFEAERQALALMDHTNIARVLDAGATESGRPYFVMELVRGIPITEYCDQNNLSIQKRLEIFGQVCQAVQHAHQKGLIHRDIKPTNVLVSTQDDRPVAKVIDFGVAKATQGQLTEKTLFTEFQHLVGTPAYMSPEQAGGSLDIDTRSDVYSLGVLLYELLAGSPPFDPKELRSKAFAEMQRIIREVEPPTPSTRLSGLSRFGEPSRTGSVQGAARQAGSTSLATLAAQRSVEPRKLAAMVRGELDWIVMKALEKDRTRRYETPGGLARDIERYLQDEPVLACPPSATYRLKKFVRRNKIAAAFILLLAAAVAALAVSNIQTRRNERRAITENAKATAVSDLLQGMLGSANPDAVKGAEYTVRKLLDDFSAGLGAELADQPEVEAEIRATIGRAYWRLGAADKAEPHLTRALELRRRQFGSDHEKVAESQVDYAWCLSEQQRQPEAEASAIEALRIYQARGTAGLPLFQARVILQRVLVNGGRHDEAQAVAEEALALARSTEVELPELATILHALADTHNAQGHYAEAEHAARQAVEMHRRLHGLKHPETAWGLVALGNALTSQQKYPEAEAALREALAIFQQLYTGDHHSLDSTLAGLKLVLEARGDQVGLAALTREELEDAAIVTDQAIVDGRLKRAQLHVERGEWDEATDDLEQASALTKENDKPRREKIAAAFVDAANRLQDHPVAGQDPDLREPLLRRALALNTELANETPGGLFHVEMMGHMYRRLGFLLTDRLDEARQHFEKAAEIFEKLAADNPQRGGYYRDYQAHSLKFLAQTLAAAGHAQEAIVAARKGVDVCQALTKEYPGNLQYRQWLASALSNLVECQVATGQTDEANATRQQAVQLWEAFLAEHPKDRDAREQLASVLGDAANELQGQSDHDLRERLLRRALALRGELDAAIVTDQAIVDSRLKRASLHAQLRAWNEATDDLEKATSLTKEDDKPQRDKIAAAYVVLCYAAFQQQKHDITESSARKAIELQPNNSAAHLWLGISLSNLGNQEDAFTAYHKAIELQPDHFGNYRSLSLALWRHGNLDEALNAIRKAIELQPEQADLYTRLGGILIDQGKVDEGRAALDKAIELNPQDTASMNQIAWFLTTTSKPQHRDPPRAVELAKKAVELAPQDGAIWNTLGVAQYRAGEWTLAIEALEKSMELRSGGDASDWFFLAMAHWQLDHKDEASNLYKKAVERMDKNQPKNEELLRFRDEAAELLGISEPATSTDAATQP